MESFKLTRAATEDMEDILSYLDAKEGERTANRIVEKLLDAFHELAKIPNSGHCRADLATRRVLFYKVHSYLVVYEPRSKPLQVLAILHGKRNIERILRKRLRSDIY